MKKILVTGVGGSAGLNFARAVKLDKKLQVIGTELNKYHKIFAEGINVVSIKSPKNPNYIESLNKIIRKNKISFVHPQTTPEIHSIVKNKKKVLAKTFLPHKDVVLKDKLAQQKSLSEKNVPVAKTQLIKNLKELDSIVKEFNYPVWVRTRTGVGGRLSNKCKSFEEIYLWIKLCERQGRAKTNEFLIQEFLGGRDIAWDSIWYNGKMIVCYTRERLEYPFSKHAMSGITGTPTVARIIHDKKVNQIGIKAVKAISVKPHGCFSVDIKEKNGVPHITEVDSGKFHTTIGLWSYAAEKNLKMPWYYNLPRLYVHLGTGGKLPTENHFNIYPEDMYLIRHLDCGVWIKIGKRKEKVI